MREFKRKKSDASTALKNENNRDFFGVQAKLNVGRPGDKYEKEADHVADKVVNKTADQPGIQKMGNGEEELQQKPLAETISTVQKQELKEEEKPVQKQGNQEEEKEVQAKCADCEKDESVQKKAETGEKEPVQKQEEEIQAKSKTMQLGIPDNNELESKLSDKKGMGNKMGTGEKQEMEAGFGADFSNVNIHTDGNAEQMSEQLGAQAFTHGNDIYFNKGKYNPGSAEGKHLLAHELTHTIQQGTNRSHPNVQASFSSTISIKHRFLQSRVFDVNGGFVRAMIDSNWSPPGCASISHLSVTLVKQVDNWFDSEQGTKRFSIGGPDTKTWSDLENGRYYLQFWFAGNTNPHCELSGPITVTT
ncbi:eCIS core domain-containing protein [Sinomicrobium sp. M5D2P17]